MPTRIDGDLVPYVSGQAHLGVDAQGRSAFDITSIAPFGHIHQVSGVFHDPILGQSGVMRFDYGGRTFQVSVDGGLTFNNLLAGTLGLFSQSFSSQSAVNVNHNLATENVIVQVRDNSSPPEVILPDSITITDINNVDLNFNGQRSGTVVVIGSGVISVATTNLFIDSRRYALIVS